jgi:serpin B
MITASRNLLRAFLGISLVFAGLGLASAATELASISRLATDNNAFALNLYARLASAGGNLFLSPYSISTCLAMTYTGARGETAQQMARTLHFKSEPPLLADTFAALQSQLNLLQQKGPLELNIANALWTQEGHPFLPTFTAVAREKYQAELQQTDFRTQAEPTRGQINDWVSQQTKGKITDLLARGVINAQTRVVLVNAIYFKGTWTRPFQKRLTADAPFNLTSMQTVTAHFMHQETFFKYTEIPDGQLLELPYTTGDAATEVGAANQPLVMDILLPRETDGLKKLEAALTAPTLAQWLAQVRMEKISVFLPRFTTTAQFNLTETLAALGMPLAFSRDADFSGMDGQLDLHISAVIHKAFIQVDETGTEAAAATGTVMALTSAISRPSPQFRADHPFLFLIRDTQSGAILFLGRINDPTK